MFDTLTAPSSAEPGSEAKIVLLEARCAAGLPLFLPGDKRHQNEFAEPRNPFCIRRRTPEPEPHELGRAAETTRCRIPAS